MNRRVKLSELQLRDVVRIYDGAYSDATVKKIADDGTVTFFRPYVATSDFDYTGGVICTIGFEEWSTGRNDQTWEVVRRA